MFKWFADLFKHEEVKERIVVKEIKCECKKEEKMAKVGDSNRQTAGDIYVGFGLHEITISMDGKPCAVFLTVQDPSDSMAVCHGGINKLGFTILDDGFVLYADIQSNIAHVNWSCTLT